MAEVRGGYRGFRYLETRGNCFSRICAVLKSKNLLMVFQTACGLGCTFISPANPAPRISFTLCDDNVGHPQRGIIPVPLFREVTPHAGIYKYPSASRNNKNIDLLGQRPT